MINFSKIILPIVLFLDQSIMAMENEWQMSNFYGCIEFKPKNENNAIDKVYIFINSNGSFYVDVMIRKNINEISYILSDFKDQTGYSCKDKQHFDFFISAFYEKDLIPDHIVSEIIKVLGIENILMKEQEFLDEVMSSFKEEYSIEDFGNALVEKLNKIKNPIRKQRMAYSLIEELKIRLIIENQLFINLYKIITDESLPFYDESRTQLSMLTSEKDSIIYSIESKTMDPMVKDTKIKGFVNGNKISNLPLDKRLKNLTVTSAKMYDLLEVIRDLNLKVSNLENK